MSTTSIGNIFERVLKQNDEPADLRKSLADWYALMQQKGAPREGPSRAPCDDVNDWRDCRRCNPNPGPSDAP